MRICTVFPIAKLMNAAIFKGKNKYPSKHTLWKKELKIIKRDIPITFFLLEAFHLLK